MTKFLGILSIVFSVSTLSAPALADVVRADGYGSSYDYCGGTFGYACISRAKDAAERYAANDLDNRCWSMQRRLQFGSVSCNSYCNPGSLPPDSPSTSVSCNAHCQGNCESK